MHVYLVGGAIRDELLGLKSAERDWVVVGATPDEMRAQGFRAVGQDFPVFLHPVSQEEYALARLERKVAPGYRGFTTVFAPTVTLEEDLQRRDLTVNAMARGADGQLVDPYGGEADLRARVLRHVSPAFVEDPVRLLRVARFAARFAVLGFTVAPETLALMKQMVIDGEVGALVAERVWRELERALAATQPQCFFELLIATGALPVVMPELAAYLRQPGPGSGSIAALQAAARADVSGPMRWATLLAGMDGGAITALAERLRAPREYSDLALLATRLGALLHDSGRPPPEVLADPAAVVGILEAGDAWRRAGRFAEWLAVLKARATAGGAPPLAIDGMLARFRSALALTGSVKLKSEELAVLQGSAIAAQLRQRRIAALRENHAI
jgi:tRNA nucleotidyltransferase (CCA-adding enzyme)